VVPFSREGPLNHFLILLVDPHSQWRLPSTPFQPCAKFPRCHRFSPPRLRHSPLEIPFFWIFFSVLSFSFSRIPSCGNDILWRRTYTTLNPHHCFTTPRPFADFPLNTTCKARRRPHSPVFHHFLLSMRFYLRSSLTRFCFFVFVPPYTRFGGVSTCEPYARWFKFSPSHANPPLGRWLWPASYSPQIASEHPI